MHAVIITAYKDFDSLLNLVQALDKKHFKLFIHIDRKVKTTHKLLNSLALNGCFVLQKHTIPWGGYAHLAAILDLLNIVLKEDTIEYVHIISGQDYPSKPIEDIITACNGSIYMTVTPMDKMNSSIRERYEKFNIFYFLQNYKKLYKIVDDLSLFIQRRLGVKRNKLGCYNNIYKGMVWISLPFDVCRLIINSNQKPALIKSLKTAYLPEEFFFQTMIMNSGLESYVVCDNLRYTDWIKRNGSSPAVLDSSDLNKIIASKSLFMRKMDSKISEQLLLSVKEINETASGQSQKLRQP
jgi:hypothetical protein